MEIIFMPILAGAMFAIISAILKIIFKFLFRLLSNGRKTGEIYYPNGKVEGRAEFNKHNQLDGEEERFYENGNIKARIKWKNGKIKEIENYYDNGNIKSRTPFVNDIIWGTVENYYKNGKLKSKVHYINGIEKEVLESYNELGEKEKKLDLDSLLNRKNK
ncbi:toxin-antitoxin system YwqK family antitoxin [Fusobacterium animalis]|uniref:toxin-antitoxin system YwqK family antitoxin n=1 Tax=Fusobacterium animalis TaxID=76859 RepID=UPI0030CD942D